MDVIDSSGRIGPDGWRGGADDRLRIAFDALPTGVLIATSDGVIELVNRELERQFGYSRDELIGRSVDLLIPDALGPTLASARTQFVSASELRQIAVRRILVGRRRDGSSICAELALEPLETSRGLFVMASVAENGRQDHQTATRQIIQERLDFEQLVGQLSGQFISLPHDQVDDAIRNALRRIGEALGLDRCNFVRLLPDGVMTESYSWLAEGVPALPEGVSAAERFPWALKTVREGGIVCFSSPDEIPEPIDRASYRAFGIRSCIAVPLWVDGKLSGAVGFDMVHKERHWSHEDVHRLRTFSTAFGNVLARQQSDEALQKALQEVVTLRDRLHAENTYLRKEAHAQLGASNVIGESAAIRRVLEQVHQVAVTDASVLLLGETGTGKELFATQIHDLSARHTRAMVRVNCAAIPSALMESELFGRERGAFTGAHARQIGRFELANHSTIFLDEIGELTPEIQVKLLRVLEERQLERLGSPRPIRVDARIIAATHRNLEQRIAEGTFREDLFYRLNVFPIRVPPLRERVEDIPLLVGTFVADFGKAFGKRVDTITPENLAALQRYAWPGNIRELRNVVERAMIVANGRELTIPVPATTAVAGGRHRDRLADVETEHIRSVLEIARWRIRGAGGAAERLGLRPTTLETRMVKLGIKRPKP
jgi:formate hydrogenlyase transcriptional activator